MKDLKLKNINLMDDKNQNNKPSNIWLIWEQQLQEYGNSGNLLYFQYNPEKNINLTRAESSGMTQLISGRKTRLSHLLKQSLHYEKSLNTAERMITKIKELKIERSIDCSFFTCGLFECSDRNGKKISAPLFLTKANLEHSKHAGDLDIQLSKLFKINPALIRWFYKNYNFELSAIRLEEFTKTSFRFNIFPAIEKIKMFISSSLRIKFSISVEYFIATFADLYIVNPEKIIQPKNIFLSALAGEKYAIQKLKEKEKFNNLSTFSELDPKEEYLLSDADSYQQKVLDAVNADLNISVRTPPASGATRTIVNTLGTLVAKGRRILIISEQQSETNDVIQYLTHLNLNHLVLDLNELSDIKKTIINALFMHDKAKIKNLDYCKLQTSHKKLKNHIDAMHTVHHKWKCSPLDVVESLIILKHKIKSFSKVFLTDTTLSSGAGRENIKNIFKELNKLGYFQDKIHNSKWYIGSVHSYESSLEAKSLVKDLLNKDFPAVKKQIEDVAKYSNIKFEENLSTWGEQLKTLVSIQKSLKIFKKDIFKFDLSNIIAATASVSWRRKKDIRIGILSRNRLKKQAKNFVLDDVSIPTNMHELLIEVQKQLYAWNKFTTTSKNLPKVHNNIQSVYLLYKQLIYKLDRISVFLKPVYCKKILSNMKYSDIIEYLESLVADQDILDTFPRINVLNGYIKKYGFEEFLQDCVDRRKAINNLNDEIDFIWWKSILHKMQIEPNYNTKILNWDSLHKLQSEYSVRDKEHISYCAAKLRYLIKQNWNQAIKKHSDQASNLKNYLLDIDSVSLLQIWKIAPDLINFLTPIWISSPFLIREIPKDVNFDSIIILNAGKTNIVSVLPAVARVKKQIIAFGNDKLGTPRPFNIELSKQSLNFKENQDSRSVLKALDDFSTQLSLKRMYRIADYNIMHFMHSQNYYNNVRIIPSAYRFIDNKKCLKIHYIPKGRSLPLTGKGGIQSVDTEVNHVIRSIIEHVTNKPESSLSVIAGSKNHALQIKDAYNMALNKYPELIKFNSIHKNKNQFIITGMNNITSLSLVRKNIIFSLGHEIISNINLINEFSHLSQDEINNLFIHAFTCAEESVTFISCFKSHDLDSKKLKNSYKIIYDFIKFAEQKGLTNYKSKYNSDNIDANLVNKKVDIFSKDLSISLKNMNIKFEANYNNAIDIALKGLYKNNNKLNINPFAIEFDASEDYFNMTIRERNRLRAEILKKYGWSYLPIASIDFFHNPGIYLNLINSHINISDQET